MKIICSWCKKFMGEKEPTEDRTETHGKCAECLRKQEGDDYIKRESPTRYEGDAPEEGSASEFQVVAKPGTLRRKRKRRN